jgi:predicted alpha/beta hydrolase family esterase
MKRVYLIHGWEGNPQNYWFPWLKSKLEAEGFEVVVPAMPEPDTPKKSLWVNYLLDLVPNPDKDTYFIGHSMGCQAIQRYLENLPEGKEIGGAVLVAGWINDPRWEGRTEEKLKVVEDWYEKPKDYELMKKRCGKFVSIYSTDDPFVPQQNWQEAEKELDAKLIMIENKGHFDDEAGDKELPEVFDSLLEMSG